MLLVFCCTIIGAAAQMLMKLGADKKHYPDLMTALMASIRNVPLILGYFLLGVNTLLLILALRKGELSVVYPIIALTYVWVTLISYFIFNEALNPYKLVGLVVIMLGVSILGRK